jgi:RNA polymerase nonessential primary-like sigma factor
MQELDHEPTFEEIAQKVGKPVEDVEKMMGLNERVTSLDVPSIMDSERPIVDTVADHQESDPAMLLQNSIMSDSILQWLDELSEKQRDVIVRRFGLRGHEANTLEDVGLEIGLTRERVRQIQVVALKRLRGIIERQGLNREATFS